MAAVLSPLLKEFDSVGGLSDLISWRNPRATGVVAGSIAFVLLFYMYMEYTMITFACRVFQVAACVGCAAATVGKCTRDPQEVHERLENYVDVAAPHVVRAGETIYQIVTFAEFVTSAKVVGASLVAAFLGNCLSDMVFVFVGFVLLFTVPVVYEKKKKEMDEILEKAHAFIDKNLGILKTKVDGVAKKNA